MATTFVLVRKGELMSDLISRQAEQQGRVFKEIVVEYPSYNTYPERKWIPYFSIKYTENGQEFIGYGTYKPEVLSQYLKEYFMPSAQPEPKWILCSERLPEEPYGCLVTVWDTNPVTMDEFENILPYFVGWDGEQWNDGDGEQCPFEVVAWMPLPEPYRGD